MFVAETDAQKMEWKMEYLLELQRKCFYNQFFILCDHKNIY